MSIIRRAVGIAAVAFSVVGLILCIASIMGLCIGKNRIETIVTALFTTADDAFGVMETRLDRVDQAVENSRQRISDLSSRAERIKNTTADLGSEIEPLAQAIDAAYSELQAAENWLDSLQAIAGGVNRMAMSVVASKENAPRDGGESARESDGVTAQRVAEISAGVADALARLQALRQELIDLRENRILAREFAAAAITRVAELDARLSSVSASIDEFDARVAAAKTSCAELGHRVHWWTAFVMITLMLVFLWFAISQIVMMKSGWRIARHVPSP